MKKLILFLSIVTYVFAPQTAFAATYKVDPSATHIGFSVRHMVIAWVRGSFDQYSGSFDFDPETKIISNANFLMKVKSINTKHAQRDAELLQSKFFGVFKYPEITFIQTGFRKLADDRLEVDGELTIKEVTRKVTLSGECLGTIKNEDNSSLVGFRIKTTLLRSDFNLHWDLFTKNGALIIGNEIMLELDVQGISK